MRKLLRTLPGLMAMLLLLSVRSSVLADPIYRNSTNDLGIRFNPGTLEIGDEIMLAGSARWLTNFSFEYWGTNSGGGGFAGAVQARVRFYYNDGPNVPAATNGYPSPNTMFFDSGWFGGPSILPTTARSTEVFTAGLGADFGPTGLFITNSDITWTVQFQGLGLGDSAGVDLYNPPTIGDSIPTSTNPLNPQDYWEYNGGWQLLTNTAPMNFGATFDASPEAVPEPAVIPLIAGALAVLGVRRKLRS